MMRCVIPELAWAVFRSKLPALSTPSTDAATVLETHPCRDNYSWPKGAMYSISTKTRPAQLFICTMETDGWFAQGLLAQTVISLESGTTPSFMLEWESG